MPNHVSRYLRTARLFMSFAALALLTTPAYPDQVDLNHCGLETSLSEHEQRFLSWAIDPSDQDASLVKRNSGRGALHSVALFIGFERPPLDRFSLNFLRQHSTLPGIGTVELKTASDASVEAAIDHIQDTKDQVRPRVGGAAGKVIDLFAAKGDSIVGVFAVVNEAATKNQLDVERLNTRLEELEDANLVDSYEAGGNCSISRFRRGNELGSTLVSVGEDKLFDQQSCVAAGYFAHYGFSNPNAVRTSPDLMWEDVEKGRSGLNLSYAGYINQMYGNGEKLVGISRGASVCEVADGLIEQRAAFKD